MGSIVYFSHGGGPLPILGDHGHHKMVEFLKGLPGIIERPDAVVVISAHWEEQIPIVIGNAAPPLLYDYYGFPEEAYEVEYPAPGSSGLAKKIIELLTEAGIKSNIDDTRGFDHGSFIPMKIMYPEADIPMIQVSLIRGLNPGEHLSMGRALRDLLNGNILVIGSGFSFHNMQAFFRNNTGTEDKKTMTFKTG